MDFVVVGIFVGAVIVGAGTVVRDLLSRQQPRLIRRNGNAIEPEALRKAWRRFCHSAGMLIVTMGSVVVLFTVAAIVFNLTDRVGWILVGTSTGLAVIVLAIGAVVIPNHYRRGGFDPVYRTLARPVPPAVISRDRVRRLGSPRIDSPDDLFSDGRPITEAVTPSHPSAPDATSEIVEVQVASGSPDLTAGVNEPGQQPEIDEQTVEVLERSEPGAATATSDQLETPSLPRSVNRAPDLLPGSPDVATLNESKLREEADQPALDQAPEDLRGESTDRVREADHPAPLFEPGTTHYPSFALPILEPPLIDPDEELPAWNAPPIPTSPPTPYIPPTNRDQPEPDSETGFESRLLADLEVPAANEIDVAGPFQSRLLNELTGDVDESAEGIADVLLDEFSIPSQDNPSGSRNANHSR